MCIPLVTMAMRKFFQNDVLLKNILNMQLLSTAKRFSSNGRLVTASLNSDTGNLQSPAKFETCVIYTYVPLIIFSGDWLHNLSFVDHCLTFSGGGGRLNPFSILDCRIGDISNISKPFILKSSCL